MGQAVAVEFDSEPRAGPEIVEHFAQIPNRVGVRAVLPNANRLDIGSVLGLSEIGRTRQQRDAAVGADIEALEEAEAETVVAGQPIIALLREQQQAVEPLGRHRGE